MAIGQAGAISLVSGVYLAPLKSVLTLYNINIWDILAECLSSITANNDVNDVNSARSWNDNIISHHILYTIYIREVDRILILLFILIYKHFNLKSKLK